MVITENGRNVVVCNDSNVLTLDIDIETRCFGPASIATSSTAFPSFNSDSFNVFHQLLDTFRNKAFSFQHIQAFLQHVVFKSHMKEGK